MAKAQCHCAVCGNDFEIKVKRRNREEATSFEEWAAKNITVCRGCEQKIRKQENHKRALENSDGLPALEGTEKQIAWAFDIRLRMKPTNTTKKISETLPRWDFGQGYLET